MEDCGIARQLAKNLQVDTAPSSITRTVVGSQIVVTRTAETVASHRITDPFPYDDAYLFSVHLASPPRHVMWIDGKLLNQPHDPEQDIQTFDLRQSPISETSDPFDCLHFYFPRRGLVEVTEQMGTSVIADLDILSGYRMKDPMLTSVSRALAVSFDNLEHANRLFMDQLALAFRAHVAHRFGGMTYNDKVGRSGLTPAQQRRAKEILSRNLSGDLGLECIASECGLTPADFAKSFRRSTGLSVARWLSQHRIDRAKALLHNSHLSIAEIAIRCGFTSPIRFARTFGLKTGLAPDVWRKVRRA